MTQSACSKKIYSNIFERKKKWNKGSRFWYQFLMVKHQMKRTVLKVVSHALRVSLTLH